MVEVFDVHLAARTAPPAPVALLPGPEPLVSSHNVARALSRRHTSVLRALDVLAAEQPALLGAELRFTTYLHENGRPNRCFHLTRAGFAALMRRLEPLDAAAAALREATLAAFGPERGLPPSAEPGPALDRDGLALMRVAGETVTVDMLRFETGEGERAVLITHGGALLLDEAVCHYPNRNWQGRRVGHVLTPLPDGAQARYQAG